MRTYIKNSTMVKPAEATPKHNLWLSNIDVMMLNDHTTTVYFYRCPTGVTNFFDPTVLKAALSRVLVAFYPAAGRLNKDMNGRIEVNCNAEGVLFVEAESDGTLDDLGDFMLPNPELYKSLFPVLDYSKGISSYPLSLLQVTHFKCGGVCLGVRNDHHIQDGLSALHFMNTWADLARGLEITLKPFIDRSHLKARNPPQPKFDHVEYYRPAPTLKVSSDAPSDGQTISLSIFKITRDQLIELKSKCNDNKDIDDVSYSTYEVLGGHLWRCICKARGLAEDQETRIRMPIDGRTRFKPPLPLGFYGNVIFQNNRIALSGEIQSKPLKYVVSIIHDAITQINDDYMRSTIDYLELQPELPALAYGDHVFESPNLGIVSWARLPIYDADFGWGKPIYMGLGSVPCEGKILVMPSPVKDGSLFLSMSLPKEQMKIFEKILYLF